MDSVKGGGRQEGGWSYELLNQPLTQKGALFKHSVFEFFGADTGSDHLPTDVHVGVFAPVGEVFEFRGHF